MFIVFLWNLVYNLNPISDSLIKRTILFLSVLLFVVGCVRDVGDSTSEVNEVYLTYWCSPNQQEIELAQKVVEIWNDEHDSVKVRLQPIPASQSSEEVLLAAIAGGTTPDICSNMWPGAMSDFIKAGGLVCLDTFPDFYDVMLSRVPDDLLESFRAEDGHFYQVPWKCNPVMMVYNVKLFKEAGIEKPPATYSEFLAAARKISKDIDGDGKPDRWMGYRDIKPIWWQRLFDFYPFYIAATGGGTLFKKGKLILNNPAAVKVFSFFQRLYMENYFPRSTLQGDQFLAGNIAVQFSGTWIVSYIERFKREDFEYDIAPVPVPDDYRGPVYTYGDPKNISIFSTTHHPGYAWEFVKFLISKANDLALLRKCTQIPVRKDLVTDEYFKEYFKENPKIRKFAEQAPYTRGVDGVPDLKEIFHIVSLEYEACCIYGVKEPGKAVQDAERNAKVVMEWNRQ